MLQSRSLLIAALALIAAPLRAQPVPTTLNYQGRLTDNTPAQAPLNAALPMRFAIWDAASGGTALWTEPASGGTSVLVVNGIFNVALGGNGVPVPPAIFTGAASARYLEITLNPGAGNEETLAPRQLITATGYSHLAEKANNADTALAANTAGSATNFTGPLGGNVTGTQSATVVASVGGQTAANVAAGSILANAAASPNTAGAIVKRDAAGNFSAGLITASLNGNANTATALAANGANCAAGQFPLGVDASGNAEGCTAAAVGGQNGGTVFGTGSLTVTAFTFADIPGLNTTLTVPVTPSGSLVYVATDGGIAPAFSCTAASCSVLVDIVLVVDGALPVHAGFQRVSCLDNAAIWQAPTAFWGMHQIYNLAPGTHTVKVQARLAGSFNAPGGAVVSAGDGTIIQGELSALVINK